VIPWQGGGQDAFCARRFTTSPARPGTRRAWRYRNPGRIVYRPRGVRAFCAGMNLVRVAIILLVLYLLGLGLSTVWPSAQMRSRDLACVTVAEPRAHTLCQAIAREMDWTWVGHATIAPGWRLTWDGLRRVFCSEAIGPDDRPALERVRRVPDWRADSGAESLLRLLNVETGTAGTETEIIFAKGSAAYVLKGGCPRT
jgi:hypothetical protein